MANFGQNYIDDLVSKTTFGYLVNEVRVLLCRAEQNRESRLGSVRQQNSQSRQISVSAFLFSLGSARSCIGTTLCQATVTPAANLGARVCCLAVCARVFNMIFNISGSF